MGYIPALFLAWKARSSSSSSFLSFLADLRGLTLPPVQKGDQYEAMTDELLNKWRHPTFSALTTHCVVEQKCSERGGRGCEVALAASLGGGEESRRRKKSAAYQRLSRGEPLVYFPLSRKIFGGRPSPPGHLPISTLATFAPHIAAKFPSIQSFHPSPHLSGSVDLLFEIQKDLREPQTRSHIITLSHAFLRR